MTDFVTAETGTTELDETAIALYNSFALFYATAELVADQVADVRQVVNGSSYSWTFFDNLTAITSALTEDSDATSVAMADTRVTLTPAEYGNVVTRTRLINVQSGGMVDPGAAFLVGRNMGTSMDGLAIAALSAFGGTTIWPNDVTSTATVGESDIMDKTFAGRLYNKLARGNVPGVAGGMYVGIAYDDVLHDLRNDTATGGWVDVIKYADPSSALRNEVGMFNGIRWLRSANATPTTDGGAGTVDTYPVNVVGFQALGKAVSVEPRVVITGPFDKLNRFLNIGWYGIFVYDTINANNQVLGICASTVGANT